MLIFKQDRQSTLAIIKGNKWFKYSNDEEGLLDYISIPRLNGIHEDYKVFRFDEILRNWDVSDWSEGDLPEGSRRE